MGSWRRIVLLLVLLLFIGGAVRLYFRWTDDFRIANITYELPFAAPWPSEVLSLADNVKLDEILNQPYSYIDKGAQCYAFGSADGQYVLKFFKFKHLRPSWLAQFHPSAQYRRGYFERKEQKLKSVFDAYDLAYREDKQNVALIYLHLTPVKDFKKMATVLDKMGIERKIDLNTTVFLIQRRGVTLRARLAELLNKNDLEAAKESIRRILNMYISEYQKGIYDKDHGVMVNAGFVGDQPFHLDAGKFSRVELMKEKFVYAEDLELVIWKIEEWIKVAYPPHFQELSAFMEKTYEDLTGGSYDRSKINLELFRTRRHSPLLNP